MPRQRLGQHFLADASWRARLAQALAVEPDDVWVEIGAGHGEMTVELAQRARRVVAIELDPRLAEQLRRTTTRFPGVEVVVGDVLALDLPRLGGGHFKVYGNLPYYITSPVLHRLLECADQMDALAVVVQLEVAARLVARPGRRQYGYLSVLAQLYGQPEITFRIPPGAFRPRPKVSSALILMRPPGARAELAIASEARFLQFVHACFAQKRKTLLNNLRVILPGDRAEALLAAVGLARSARAEQLSLEKFAELFRRLPGA